jgi:hypothetical protein
MKLQIYTKILSSLFKSLGNIKTNVKERRPLPKDDVSEDDPAAEENEKVIVNKPTEKEFVWHDLKNVPRTKERGESKGDRDWKNITGITIHQTACQFGNNPQRVLNVPVHGVTLSDGSIVLLHPPTNYLWHANSLNKTDIGIELSCNVPGVEGVAETFWLPKKYKYLKGEERLARASLPTEKQLEATKRLIKYYVDEVAENGGKIKYIHAHRQSSKSRVADPGEQIWKAVGEWAVEELGLDPHYGWTKGGLPLPDVWTGKANGVRYSSKYDGRLKK